MNNKQREIIFIGWIILVTIITMSSSCSYYTSDPTRPDMSNKARKVQQERLKSYGQQN